MTDQMTTELLQKMAETIHIVSESARKRDDDLAAAVTALTFVSKTLAEAFKKQEQKIQDLKVRIDFLELDEN